MAIILDTRTQSTMKSVQYIGRQDPGGYIENIDSKFFTKIKVFGFLQNLL